MPISSAINPISLPADFVILDHVTTNLAHFIYGK